MRHTDHHAAISGSDDRFGRRTSRRALIGGGITMRAGIGSVTRPAGAQGVAPDGLVVFPRFGTRTASPGTEISFRGVTGKVLGW